MRLIIRPETERTSERIIEGFVSRFIYSSLRSVEVLSFVGDSSVKARYTELSVDKSISLKYGKSVRRLHDKAYKFISI